MNGLFNCLNSRRPEHVQYNEAEHIATLKENVTWLNNCCDYIESLPKQRQACFLTKPTSEALRVTLLSTIALVENLLASGFRYVLVGNFGQDPLELVKSGRSQADANKEFGLSKQTAFLRNKDKSWKRSKNSLAPKR
ncbi:hypothetical protein MRX96_018369 [Rhipicephalus microplus]